ncbi:hypothetical protein E4U42_003407 [Claviceps africana]|uniref:2EXR domain-containing protein n=1 Tax=Claviceps africana TaxID=83212 RepID=A0A8K0J799_9HYPO|nr:hypothetical protein E4U42_003407 [Claviceps africana]
MASAHSGGGPKTKSQNALVRSQHQHRDTTFADLPAEVRLKIWSCAVEPRVVILDDLTQRQKSYPLPSVTQLNAEARAATRRGYEAVGPGSCFHFSRDILVCDANISDQRSNVPLENLGLRVQRLAFWDCFPDDDRIDGLHRYSAYLAARYPRIQKGKIEFDKLWFPNLRDLWIIKIGEVDPSWMVGLDKDMPYELRLQEMARQFRYWVDEDVIEIAPLDLNEAETKMILREGRCAEVDCQQLNLGRQKMVSKVVFKDGKYNNGPEPGEEHLAWRRVRPWSTAAEQGSTETDTSANRIRWIIVERTLTFSLRWDDADEMEDEARAHRRARRGQETEPWP